VSPSADHASWGRRFEPGARDHRIRAAGISEARADRYLGHAGTTVSDRYRHRLRGQLDSDAARLDDYLQREVAPIVALPADRLVPVRRAIGQRRGGDGGRGI